MTWVTDINKPLIDKQMRSEEGTWASRSWIQVGRVKAESQAAWADI